MSTEEVKPITVKKLPLILKKKILVKKGIKSFNNSNIKVVKSFQNSYQEDVIYASTPGDFTSGEARNMTIVNRWNVFTRSNRTVAKCQSHAGEVYEKTSDEVTRLLGPNNYDIVFTSLCSLLSQELKIRSINSLLTVPKKTKVVSCQTDNNAENFCIKKNVVDTSCQTHETSLEDLKKFKIRKRNKRQQLAPYVVKDNPETKKPKRVVVYIKEEKFNKNESQTTIHKLPELGSVFDEDSNNSVGRFSSLSVTTTPELMFNPMNIITNVDRHTKDTSNNMIQQDIIATDRYLLHNLDSCSDTYQPEVKSPLGMKEQLQSIPSDQRIKHLMKQGIMDWKFCLTPDNDGHLPIHVAVLTNNIDLLRRQCLALKMRETSVDLPADGLTPLRMSLFQENTQLTAVLLDFGADPLDTDEEDRTPIHIAAEMTTDHLQILVNYCQLNARKILEDNEDLWKPVYENKSDQELSRILLRHINRSYNSQGYTPLMLATKLGKYNNVMTLVESCKEVVNVKMPNSGNTALYLAVGAACMDSSERGNKSKVVDHFRKTVEILVENGADPNIDNFAGISVNDLLAEFNIGELSMLIANKLTSVRYFDGQMPTGNNGSDFMLVKDKDGKVHIKDVKDIKKEKPYEGKTLPIKTPTTRMSPVILENVAYTLPSNANNSTVVSKPMVPSHIQLRPVKLENSGNTVSVKQENVNVSQSYKPLIKNFQLNRPLILKSQVRNNKRKLEIVEDTSKCKKYDKSD